MIKRFIVIVAVFFTVMASAQENVSSPYSYYGIGLTNFKGTVENRSMGGLSTFSDSIHLNLRNPASYGRLKLTNYSVGGSHERVKLQTNTAEDRAKITSLDYLAIGVPVGKFGFGLGVMPYTSVGYRILDVEENQGSRLTGRGGMNKVFLTAAYEISESLSVGVDAQYNFGNFQNRRSVAREGIELGTRDIRRTDIIGFNFKFGVDYQRMISDNLKLHASASYAPEARLDSENYREISTIAFLGTGEVVLDKHEFERVDSQFDLPSELTVGAGLGKPNSWFVGGEYTGRGTSAFGNSFNTGDENVAYQDAAHYRLGGYFIPQYNSLTSYFKRVVYRAGLRFEETGLHLRNESINEFGISFGVGLPVGANFSNANLGIEYGQRGTTDSDLIKENFFKISIGLSLNDKWFEKRKFN
ncbi:hypothetical protein [Salegentibacter chungangensis]|uniref:Long-subunit fatty acid transport protein n=1 Tax=Salegentibacter chungangensis TaxID=1335724 RepID=A0ABW3NN10_9FLAO